MNINELIERSHAMATEKGWWPDGPVNRPVCELVNNFHAEISEAWEEWRSGRMELWWSLDGARVHPTDTTHEAQDNWGKWRPAKPEGFWVEIADLCIRLADTMGAMGWKWPDQSKYASIGDIKDLRRLVSGLHCCVANLIDIDNESLPFDECAESETCGIVFVCVTAARTHGVDLLDVCELKMAYNATRPQRHGWKNA